jgi:ankyrin repeat protein
MQLLAGAIAAADAPTLAGAAPAGHTTEKAFLQAATFGNTAAVGTLLKQGVNPDATAADKNRRSALILATAGGHREAVKAILVAGADVDYRDAAGLSALNWAAIRSQNHVAQLLLSSGADVNTRDNNGVSPLLYSVGTRNTPLVQLLADSGADLDVLSDANKMTPLLVAAENGDMETLVLLLELGANVNGGTLEGYVPLMAAAESGQLKVVELLLSRGADPGKIDRKGMSASLLAQKNGHTDVHKLLAQALAAAPGKGD